MSSRKKIRIGAKPSRQTAAAHEDFIVSPVPVPRPDVARAATFVAFLTITGFWHVVFNGFINLDDYNYVRDPHVLSGLSWENMRWAFTSMAGGYWHPLAWISHMLDTSVFGDNAGGHHLTSLLLHICNSVLLLIMLVRATRQLGPSTFVAALFAIHPLHVESVAWAAARKDVLSTLFWMLTWLAYVWYAEHRTTGRYLAVMAGLLLGLLAKPMLVTLPFSLLLLDIWPLGRTNGAILPRRDSWKLFARLVLEKLPLFALVFTFSVIAYVGQKRLGTVVPTGDYGLTDRVGNAVLSYAWYLIKMVWPSGLAPFYPHPADRLAGAAISWGTVAAAALFLALITVCVVRFARRHPYLPTGWMYYLGTLLPVIGLVQVANFGMADRYTYIALTGPFIMVAWGVRALLLRRIGSKYLAIAAALVLLALLVSTNLQVYRWRSPESLYKHSIAVTRNNYILLGNLGATLSDAGRREEAIPYFRQALALNPDAFVARMSLGATLAALNRLDEAAEEFKNIARVAPTKPDRFLATGDMLRKIGRFDEAAHAYSEALRLNPDYTLALANLASVELRRENYSHASELYARAAALEPDNAAILTDYAYALYRTNRFEEAHTATTKALALTPDSVPANVTAAKVLLALEHPEDALSLAEKAVRLAPNDPEPHVTRANIYMKLQRYSDAVADYAVAAHMGQAGLEFMTAFADALMQSGDANAAAQQYTQAAELAPTDPALHATLARALLRAGNPAKAIPVFERSLQMRPGDPNILKDLAEARRQLSATPASQAPFGSRP